MAGAATLYGVILGRLNAINGIDVYGGEVPAQPPYDEDGRVRKYAFLHGAPGALYSSALDGNQTSVSLTFQVTCVGGDDVRALECVDLVRTGLLGAVTIDGKTRLIRASEDDLGQLVRADRDVWPPRHYVPLEFLLIAP